MIVANVHMSPTVAMAMIDCTQISVMYTIEKTEKDYKYSHVILSIWRKKRIFLRLMFVLLGQLGHMAQGMAACHSPC